MDGDTQVHISSINGHKFVSGLYWQPLTRPQAYMKEAREIGKQRGLDIVAIRKSETVIQGGFVSKNDGAYKGMYSLAASLAGQLGDTWLGAFKLPGGSYALVGILKGGVIPGADIVGDLETISAALRAVYAYKHGIDDDQIYAPPEMEFGGKEIDLERILTPACLRKEYMLRPLTFGLSKKQWMTIGVVAATVLIGTGGYMKWSAMEHKRKHDLQVLAAKAMVAEMEAENARKRAELAAKSIVHPWALIPAMKDFVGGCREHIEALPLSAGGWMFESTKCDGKSLVGTYLRSGNATMEDFSRAVSAKKLGPEPVFYSGGDKAGIVQVMSLTQAGDEQLLSVNEVAKILVSHFQRIGIKPELTEIKVEPPAPVGLPGQEQTEEFTPPPPDWKKFEFTVDTTIPPHISLEGLVVPGVRITEITNILTANHINWEIKGEFYAK